MDILIAGASGLIGRLLVPHLSQKHDITVLGRNLKKLVHIFPEKIKKLTYAELNTHNAAPYHMVMNFAGENISAHRWTLATKKELILSRTSTTQQLIEWLKGQKATPRFFCANAVGIYGAHPVNPHSWDESTPLPPHPQDFLQRISFAWEEAAKTAEDAGIPVITLRLGVVLKKNAGMLKKLEIPFRLGCGSVLGTGQQMLSWIHGEDLKNAIDFLIQQPSVKGPVNLTAPLPISQHAFAHQLAHALKKPLLFKMPSWVVKCLWGEMGALLLLKGQKIFPQRLTEMEFQFLYPDIRSALSEIYGTAP